MGLERVKRVLLLVGSPAMGGIAAHVLAAAGSLAAAGWEGRVAYLAGRRGQPESLRELAASVGVEVERLPMPGPWGMGGAWTLRRLLGELRPDVVHCHGYRATLLSGWAGVGVPIVSTCHGRATEADGRARGWQMLEIRTMRRRPLTIACSEHTASWLASQGVPSERLRVVWNGCTGPQVVPKHPRDSLTVAYVGRLVAGKGIEALMAACAALEARLLIAGDGPLRAALESQAAALGVRTEFLGLVEDVSRVFGDAAVVALPSSSEALPMTLIEAAAHGRPVVAAAVGGIPEVVGDGESGILVPPNDEVALREALAHLLDDRLLREALGRGARLRWERFFTCEAMAQRLAAVYDEAVGASGSA